jgi:hypothetical protein
MSALGPVQLRSFAQQHDFELEQDPFHGARAFEFRRRINGKLRCVGVIFGSDQAEVYRRYLDPWNEFVHRRLWFLKWLLPATPAAEGYEVIARMREEEVGQRLEQLVKAEIGQPG